MALIVEDGSIVANSNSYVDQTYATNYFALFGNSDWVANDDIALIHATRAIDLLYGQRFQSVPAQSTQSLLWPRFVMVINGIQIIQTKTIPRQLKDAVCEVALMYQQGINIYPTPNTQTAVSQDTVKIGPLEFQKGYKSTIPSETFENFNKIDLLLTPLLVSGNNQSYTPGRFTL
jgi:hypothetical protein